ncbi:toll/interleukin-1 receptor domain-containing protein [Streptomyces sp. SP18CS02]|uniref:toll/interleukin-1 receptor domain-containing protein n=1 Tax=Streptomyces sp. SP18CS02 TaxID=3002531 RepID=UPI002E78DBF9|nr:toll/interleukin-1 receptor domain-containing protein [Streptomyces sp. SP18CS02]MEE1753957.1 toll/interleukin-1 receptor domain-containing protein [Streptomyces sp. SP18CS02]
MRIFISWSGNASRQCAEVLRSWLPIMNQSIEPFVSSQDISKGERGLHKIADKLQESAYGIVCVTRDNQAAPWINFEAGALSRELGESRLAPFLLDLAVKDLSAGPMTQFQATESSSRDDVLALVKSINDKCEKRNEHLETLFEKFWDDLRTSLEGIRSSQPANEVPERETSDILNELVSLVREQSSRLQHLEGKVARTGDVNTTTHYTINEPHEVKIQSEEPESRTRRLLRTVRDAIGAENVVKAGRKAGILQVITNTEGMENARQFEMEIADAAASCAVGLEIKTPDGDTLLYPPF